MAQYAAFEKAAMDDVDLWEAHVRRDHPATQTLADAIDNGLTQLGRAGNCERYATLIERPLRVLCGYPGCRWDSTTRR